jgi:hypothetical protein
MRGRVTERQRRQIAHSRLQEADRVVEAYELAEQRILALQGKLGGPMLSTRLRACQDQLKAAREHQAAAWVAWEELSSHAG